MKKFFKGVLTFGFKERWNLEQCLQFVNYEKEKGKEEVKEKEKEEERKVEDGVDKLTQ